MTQKFFLRFCLILTVLAAGCQPSGGAAKKTETIKKAVVETPTTISKQVACSAALPSNATWNASKDTFTQTQTGATNPWQPATVVSSYLASGTQECTFKCNTNFNWNSASSQCVSTPVVTRKVVCAGALPINANWSSGQNTFTQTQNGASWLPASLNTSFSSSGSSECQYSCKANYTYSASNISCAPNTQQLACGGALPINARYLTAKNTFTQTWSASSWQPSTVNSTYAASGSGECVFACGSDYNYISTSNICEKKLVVTPPVEDNAKMSFPANAVLVPYSKRATLQAELDKYKIIRLEVGNYAYVNQKPGPSYTWGEKYPALRVSSGQKIYGMPGTGTPELIIEPGSTDIVISGVSAGSLTFPTSNLVTKGNTFKKLRYTNLSCVGCTIEDNAFFDLSWTGISFDFMSGGYLRNNRFVRTLMQGGKLQMKIWGHPSRSSYGNVFVFVNFLTPDNATDIRNLDDFTIVGFDAESYVPSYALLRTQEMGSLRILAAGGANNYVPVGQVDDSTRSGLLDSNADEIIFLDVHTGTHANPQILLREKNKTFFDINSTTNWSFQDLAPNATRIRFYPLRPANVPPALNKVFLLNNAPMTQELSAAQKDKIPKFLYDDAVGAKQIPWPKPVFQSVPDPLGSGWRQTAANCPDVSDQLQRRLDAEKTINLDPGTYCISKSLKVQLDGGIIGSGMNKTIILAKNQNIDILIPSNWVKGFFGSLTLMDLTLQGGRTGFRVDTTNVQVGGEGILNGMHLGYVNFREFALAGMYFTAMFGIDNNFFDNLYFVNNKYGIFTESLPVPSTAPVWDQIVVAAYADKNLFYQNQFINNSSAVLISGSRANNLNVFFECLFKDNTESAAELRNANSSMYVSSEFNNNAGNPSLPGNGSIYILNTNFIGGPLTKTMLGGQWQSSLVVEGSTFERGSADLNARIFADGSILPCNNCHPAHRLLNAPEFVGFYNNNAIDIGLGGPVEYVGINSFLPLNPELNKKLAVITGKARYGGVSKTIVYDSDVPNPSPRFLTTREK